MSFQNTTLGTLKTRLAEKYDGQIFWSADQARRAINEGLRIYNLITGIFRTPTVVTTIPNDPYLAVAGVLIKGTRVTIGGRVLAASSLWGLDYGRHGWEGATILSGGMHPSQITDWAPVGLTEIALYPADSPSGVTSVTVDGVICTTPLVADGDFLNLGDEEINTLLGYALHVLSFAKGSEALAKTQPYRIAFYKAAALRNATFAASSMYRKIIGEDRLRTSRLMVRPPTPLASTLMDSAQGQN